MDAMRNLEKQVERTQRLLVATQKQRDYKQACLVEKQDECEGLKRKNTLLEKQIEDLNDLLG
jgi:cell division protein FtsB